MLESKTKSKQQCNVLYLHYIEDQERLICKVSGFQFATFCLDKRVAEFLTIFRFLNRKAVVLEH